MENQASEMLKILLIVSQMYAGFKPSKNASSASNTITTQIKWIREKAATGN
jgi:hypothetical protein